jgi:hypothetical protein
VAKHNTARKESAHEKPSSGRVRAVAGGNSLPDLDRLIHERMRLGIVSALAANRWKPERPRPQAGGSELRRVH